MCEKMYFSIREIAERFGVSVQTVNRMVQRGQLQAVRLGTAIRVPASEVQKLEAGEIQ